MAKPSVVPTWATDGLAFKNDPGVPKRALGWLAGEKPPADWWNWFVNLQGQWAAYLNTLEGEALTWTAAHAFNAAVTLAGALVANGSATFNAAAAFAHNLVANGQSGDQNPVVETTAVPTARKLLWKIRANTGGTSIYARIYASVSTALEVTVNARWDGTQWVPDSTGTASSKFKLDHGKLLYSSAVAGPANFTDVALETKRLLVDLGFYGANLTSGSVLGVGNGATPTEVGILEQANRPRMTQVSSFSNSWAANSTFYRYLDHASEHHFYGTMLHSTGGGGQALTMFNIGSGTGRPAYEVNLPVACQQGGNPFVFYRLRVTTGGDVSVPDLPDNTDWRIYMTGLSYPAGTPP